MQAFRFLNSLAGVGLGNQIIDWSKGPWEDEPDFVEFIHKETSYLVRAIRHDRTGHWNGYVGTPLEHPASKLSNQYELPERVFGAAYRGISLVEKTGSHDLGFTPTDDGKNWTLFGFDTAHWNDAHPIYIAYKGNQDEVKTSLTIKGEEGYSYKSLKFVLEYCDELANQLKSMEEAK